MAQKTSIPKGTRDFSPAEMAKRNYIFDTIRSAFRLFGYRQIETPAMENLSTLMGKYGEEGDKLLFKILNSGDFMKKVDATDLEARELNRLGAQLCEKGLRYDLTVPFARYVVQHRNDIQFPFKRFQMQPVWRADRPQKGRYREFWQCDADVVGSDSLLNEIELLSLLDYVFAKFGLRVCIKLNNRKILSGIAELIGESDRLIDITVAIDKIDKIGIEAVEAELIERGISEEAVSKLRPILALSGSNEEKLNLLADMLQGTESGEKGVEELRTVYNGFMELSPAAETGIDVSLARGLNYYTGVIIEVKALDTPIGSISGGGRYDNLTGVFGLSGVSGVGISFGADRIYDVLDTLGLFPDKVLDTMTVLFLNLGKEEAEKSARCVAALRKEGVSAALYPDSAKLKKQFQYADSLNVPLVAMIGEEELKNDTITVRDMATGSQSVYPLDEVSSIFRIYQVK